MGRKKLRPFIAEFTILDAATDGRAVAKKDDRVIFIPRGVPGDLMEVEVYKREKKAWVGRMVRLLEPSNDRIAPRCQHFGNCGGCKWQMMAYTAQLRYKQKQVQDNFDRIAKVEVGECLPIMGVEEPYFYRNKLEFTFGSKAWLTTEQIAQRAQVEHRVLGFHAPGFFDKILDIHTCYLQDPLVDEVRNALREFVHKENIPFYHVKEHTGYLRNLVFRNAQATGEWMLLLIVAEDKPAWIDKIFTFIAESFPQLDNLVWIVNEKLNSSYSDLPSKTWKGNGYITEKLGNRSFQVSPTSFFQTNTRQAERLYSVIKQWMQALLPMGTSRFGCVYDLYTGTGSIALYVADLAKKIVGIEYVDSSIKDAQKNVALNAVNTQFSFHAGDMKKLLTPELVAAEGKPELIISDPPRQGMDPKVVKRLLEIGAPYLIYVSCKPSTQARDVALLAEAYEVVKIQPVDMFPQTAHVENIALLKHRDL